MMNAALVYEQFGNPADVVRMKIHPLPEPSSGQTIVKMLACPVNPSDLIPITGAYAHRIALPMVCGYEGLGIVEKNGPGTTEFPAGARVLITKHPGTWSERIVVNQDGLVAIPETIPDEVAARSYINPMTCALLLKKFEVAEKRIVITGGGSTCAMLLSQMAVAQGARQVDVVIRRPETASEYRDLEISTVSAESFDHLTNLVAQADLVLDCVGGDFANALLPSLGLPTRFISYGLLSGQRVDDGPFAAQIDRFYLKHEQVKFSPAQWRALFDKTWPVLSRLKFPASKSFKFREYGKALAYYESGTRQSKPVLEFEPS